MMSRVLHARIQIWRWEKHKKEGWIVLGFFLFSRKLKYTDQKQFKNSFWSDVQN